MYDACVIGAGLSGLVCARALAAAGRRVVVVEARERVGGRLVSARVAGQQVDAGGQWLTAGQHRLSRLVAELGVGTREHPRRGRALVDDRAGLVAALRGALAQRRAVRSIERLMREIPPDDPAAARDAAALDRTTLASWLSTSVRDPVASARLQLHAELVFACDPADLSLLSYLSILRATGGFRPDGPDLPGGGREHRITGGAQLITERLAAALGARAELRLGFAVTAVADEGDAVRVRGPGGLVEARRCVLALPPQQVKRIAMELPRPHRSFVDGARMGPVVKVFAAYERPFWRDDGLSGEAYLPDGTVRATVDVSSPAPDEDGQAGILCAFVVGRPAARWAGRAPEQRKEEVLATLAEWFGARALRPVDYLEYDWAADPWSGGCVASTLLDVIAGGGRWRDPHGNLHVAGTESAVRWPGYMDGAVEAGERAAAEVDLALARR